MAEKIGISVIVPANGSAVVKLDNFKNHLEVVKAYAEGSDFLSELWTEIDKDQTFERYRAAFEKIAALESVREVRGGFEEIDCPEHLVKEGGTVPIHPRMKSGLKIAAKIAKEALEARQ